jgi:hypothetical protein
MARGTSSFSMFYGFSMDEDVFLLYYSVINAALPSNGVAGSSALLSSVSYQDIKKIYQ